ncbi:Silenced mating-type M-specific polypeptide Mc [Leucoagaricus sp. SymC.cos]|nr:Silenced mating-type M-specific polypeptide Mc [Leucoagaricus sp. SymC.cos]
MAGVARTIPSHSARSAPQVVKAPRPPNAWIIYRSDKVHQLPPLEPGQPRRAQAEVSKLISNMWANESEETRQEYERRAEEAKAAHALKYPGYRFKPMKKEEKRAQREQEQSERLAKRRDLHKSGSTPDRSSVPPSFTAPLPQYYASINMPINLSQAGHNSPHPLPYPFTPFYPSQTQFGPAGPTPPVSAAASPSNSSLSPEASASTDESQSPSSALENVDPSRSNTTQVKGTVSMASIPSVPASGSVTTREPPVFPAFNTATFANGQEWTGAPMSTIANNGTLTPALTPSPLWQDADSNPQQQQPLQEPPVNTGAVSTETVSFDFEPFQLTNLENLFSGSTDDPLSVFLNATNDSAIFEMNNIDPQRLTTEPTGEIEVSLGGPLDLNMLPPLFDFGDLGMNAEPDFFIPHSTIPNDGDVQAGTRDPSPATMSYSLDEYLDFGPSSTLGEANDIPILAPAVCAAQAVPPVVSNGPGVCKKPDSEPSPNDWDDTVAMISRTVLRANLIFVVVASYVLSGVTAVDA